MIFGLCGIVASNGIGLEMSDECIGYGERTKVDFLEISEIDWFANCCKGNLWVPIFWGVGRMVSEVEGIAFGVVIMKVDSAWIVFSKAKLLIWL